MAWLYRVPYEIASIKSDDPTCHDRVRSTRESVDMRLMPHSAAVISVTYNVGIA